MKHTHRTWTPDEVEYLRLHYKHNLRSANSIGHALNRSVSSVEMKVQRIHIARHRCNNKKWTTEDLEFLRENYGDMTMSALKEELKCNTTSIYAKAKAIGLVRTHRNETYSLEEIMPILGIGHKIAIRWINDGKLRATREPRADNSVSYLWRITASDLKDFIKTYPYELVGRNVDIMQIIELVSGINGKIYEER